IRLSNVKSGLSMPVVARPKVRVGMTPRVFKSGLNWLSVYPTSLFRMRPQSESFLVPNPSVARRTPAWNSLTPEDEKIRFQPPLIELSPDSYEPLKKPHFAGPAVISEPYGLGRPRGIGPPTWVLPEAAAVG